MLRRRLPWLLTLLHARWRGINTLHVCRLHMLLLRSLRLHECRGWLVLLVLLWLLRRVLLRRRGCLLLLGRRGCLLPLRWLRWVQPARCLVRGGWHCIHQAARLLQDRAAQGCSAERAGCRGQHNGRPPS